MTLPPVRDPRFVTIRRGGTLTDADHGLLARWAADCAEHVLPLFPAVRPDDPRPAEAIALARAWTRGEVTMTASRSAAGHASAAARDLRGAARHAAFAAAQAAAVAHVAAHELGAAAYAIKAVRASVPDAQAAAVGCRERDWQRVQLPDAIRALVLDDQRLRDGLCWGVFGSVDSLVTRASTAEDANASTGTTSHQVVSRGRCRTGGRRHPPGRA